MMSRARKSPEVEGTQMLFRASPNIRSLFAEPSTVNTRWHCEA
jgi:hypothetical protein